ncbi:TonB-dependent outer membrane receptor, SusC/RagA subfamily, signature region [Bacteroidales bacterium Barb4]|nr:TonB-dependent outer membrane receptor, SusC/RagA subfamily, signature region [Bacteroidales bacterium Barb4]
MDATEIESVSVLKDTLAAIYGLHSANGVLLVTTKRRESSRVLPLTGF